MKFIRTLLVLAFFSLLVACGTKQPNVKTEYVFRPIPEALLQDCNGTPPPAKTVYLAANWDQREEMWTETYRRQELGRKLCNTDKKNLRAWNQEQKALYDKSKEAP